MKKVFLEKNVSKLKVIQEIETILSENNIGINDFEEIVSQIKTDYKNNPLDSKNIKRKYNKKALRRVLGKKKN